MLETTNDLVEMDGYWHGDSFRGLCLKLGLVLNPHGFPLLEVGVRSCFPGAPSFDWRTLR